MKWALSRKNVWERTPRWVKASLRPALHRVRPETVLGGRFREQLSFVRQAQHWSADQVAAFQLQKLQQLCRLAAEHSPFYRDHFAGVGFEPGDLRDVAQLRQLPCIDKDTLRQHLDEMVTQPPESPGVDYVTTGGTGGTPVGFYIGAGRSATEYAYLVAGWERAGYRLGTPMAVFRGRVVKRNRRGLRHEYDPLLRHHYYSNFHMTDRDLERYLAHVARIGPCYLHGYPSSATAIARYIKRTGEAPPANVQGVLAESEIVYPEQRAFVEETLGVRLFSSYGMSEKLVAAALCEHTDHYHVWPTYGLFELIDEHDQPVTTPGQRGQIVGTSFINTVTPCLRYRTGDEAVYRGEQCPACGRVGPIIEHIRGHRVQEHLVTASGSLISWTALNMHDDTFDNVRQFQFVQDAPGRAQLRIVPTCAFSDADQQRLLSRLERKFDGQLHIELERCLDIPLSPRGKAIYVDQRIREAGPGEPASDETDPEPGGRQA